MNKITKAVIPNIPTLLERCMVELKNEGWIDSYEMINPKCYKMQLLCGNVQILKLINEWFGLKDEDLIDFDFIAQNQNITFTLKTIG